MDIAEQRAVRAQAKAAATADEISSHQRRSRPGPDRSDRRFYTPSLVFKVNLKRF